MSLLRLYSNVPDKLSRPHLGSSRKIHTGQKIHSSLTLSDNTQYTPKARPLVDNPNFWMEARTKGLGDWLAMDLYEYTETLVEKLITGRTGTVTVMQTLRETAMSGPSAQFFIYFLWLTVSPSVDGRQAVYKAVIEALKNHEPAEKHQLLHSAMDILGKSVKDGTSLKLFHLIEIRPLLSNLLESNIESYKSVARQFLVEFMDCKCKAFYPHLSDITLPRLSTSI